MNLKKTMESFLTIAIAEDCLCDQYFPTVVFCMKLRSGFSFARKEINDKILQHSGYLRYSFNVSSLLIKFLLLFTCLLLFLFISPPPKKTTKEGDPLKKNPTFYLISVGLLLYASRPCDFAWFGSQISMFLVVNFAIVILIVDFVGELEQWKGFG